MVGMDRACMWFCRRTIGRSKVTRRLKLALIGVLSGVAGAILAAINHNYLAASWAIIAATWAWGTHV